LGCCLAHEANWLVLSRGFLVEGEPVPQRGGEVGVDDLVVGQLVELANLEIWLGA